MSCKFYVEYEIEKPYSSAEDEFYVVEGAILTDIGYATLSLELIDLILDRIAEKEDSDKEDIYIVGITKIFEN